MFTIPYRAENHVPEPKHQDVVYHLLPKVMVDAKDLLLSPVRFQCALQCSRTFKISTKRLLNLYDMRLKVQPSDLLRLECFESETDKNPRLCIVRVTELPQLP